VTVLGKCEQTLVTCDSCGRIFFRRESDPRDVLAQARAVGWECPAVNAKDRYGDTCPRCAHPELYADVRFRQTGKAGGAHAPALVVIPRAEVGAYREVMSAVLREETAPGFSLGEEVVRVVVAGALAGDPRMTRLIFDVMDGGGHGADSDAGEGAQALGSQEVR
jgi:hypothetical protein